MKLHGMADAFRAQIETADASQLGFEERFAMLVDQQWLWKENRARRSRTPVDHHGPDPLKMANTSASETGRTLKCQLSASHSNVSSLK